MYKVVLTSRFKKAFKRCKKRNLNIQAFEEVLGLLISTGTLPQKYHPHKLSSKYNHAWECHIEPDWLLVWEQEEDTLTFILIYMRSLRTSSNSSIMESRLFSLRIIANLVIEHAPHAPRVNYYSKRLQFQTHNTLLTAS